MNGTTVDLDQPEEETLSYDVSDEALEAAARQPRAPADTTYSIFSPFCV